jgi:uncharacterized SAM-binding protein YcdF (DUF218 family)
MLGLEKIVASFLALPGLLWVCWLIVTIYLYRKRGSRLIRLFSLLVLIVFYFLITALGTGILVLPLENIYDNNSALNQISQPYPIVVLGGGIEYGKSQADLSPYSLERLVKGYQIYKKVEAPIVYTGGVAIGQSKISESEVAADWLAGMGVNRGDIILEDQARTTYENALYIKDWLVSYRSDQRADRRGSNSDEGQDNLKVDQSDNLKIYLVSNAIHLPRAVGVFRKQGIAVIPISAGIITDHRRGWLDYFPGRDAFTANMMAVHEWLGIVWYRMTGRL